MEGGGGGGGGGGGEDKPSSREYRSKTKLCGVGVCVWEGFRDLPWRRNDFDRR